MNHDLDLLQPYPFERLRELFSGAEPPSSLAPIRLSIGEPQHAAPALVREALVQALESINTYPATAGQPALRKTISQWLQRRFALPEIDPQSQVLPVTGTREALFAIAQAVIDRSAPHPSVICPNPFYQIYEGAALLAGAQPHFLNCTADNGFLPDFDAVTEQQWRDCQLLFICSPGNPTGTVMPMDLLRDLIERARAYDFVIASDECYSEIYADEDSPPPGLLQAAASLGDTEYRQCLVFHSLSKRSNLPGLRSGFVAGDAELIRRFLTYRTYHGCAMPPHHQAASIAAWSDEAHVLENRQKYREKFDAVLARLPSQLLVERPDAGFYLWPRVEGADTDFARGLFQTQHVTVLPGQYLGREHDGINPGAGHLRMALVAELDQCLEAVSRIDAFVRTGVIAC